MLLWGNLNHNFNEATMGYLSQSNFEAGIFKKRDWAQPHLVTYMESHDEERLMFKNQSFGNTSNPAHNTKDLNTALKRNEMAASFWAMIPAPKMLWQFQELGYDYSINYCENGTINNNCRTNPKPVRWDYVNNPNRKALYDVYAKLLQLRNIPNYLSTFVTDDINYKLDGAFKWLQVSSDSLKIMVIGNFDVTTTTGTVTFQNAGTWYNYLNGGTRTASGTAENITLQPGEYYVYSNRNVNNLTPTPVRNIENVINNMRVSLFPNPVNREATVQYDLPESGKVEISVINNVGQQVASLFSGFKLKGVQSIPLNSQLFNAGKISTGTYLLKFNVNGKIKIQQFIVQH